MLFPYGYDLGLGHGLDEGVEGQYTPGGQLNQSALQLGATGRGHDETIRRHGGNTPGTGREYEGGQEQDEEASVEGSRHSLPLPQG